MNEPSPGTIELTCPGCHAYFRLKPKKGKFPKGPIPCPKCSTSIPLNIPGNSAPSEKESSPASQSGILIRPKASASTSPRRSTQVSNRSTSPALSEESGSAFLRAANRFLDEPNRNSLNSTYQGFGISENLKKTSENEDLKKLLADEASSDERSSTDTSHFKREERTKAIDPALSARIKEDQARDLSAHKSETPISGIEAMQNIKTPVGGIPAVPVAFSVEEDGTFDESGPFDMRDIVAAERERPGPVNPNEVTRNPLLPQDELIEASADAQRKIPTKPLPEDPFNAMTSSREQGSEGIGASRTAVHDDEEELEDEDRDWQDTANLPADAETTSKKVTSPKGYPSTSEPLLSRSDIFTDADSASLPEISASIEQRDTTKEVPRKDILPDTAQDEAQAPQKRSPKPLAAMLRKKFGDKKLESIRGSLHEESAVPHTMVGLPSASEIDDASKPPISFSARFGAGEEDLDKMLDEADSKRTSGEHNPIDSTRKKDGPVVHTTKPALQVSEELSQKLSALTPPSSEDSSPGTPSVGESFRQRIAADHSPDLEPGQPPKVKGSSLLARLKPHKVRADQTGEILRPKTSPTQQQPSTLPDAASIFADDAQSGNMPQPIDVNKPKKTERLTPVKTPLPSDIPTGISWATADSLVSASTAMDDAPSVVRRRHRQESHSGLFPISGGLGQEDSVGMASERQGSGYIRLPTSEIIDVLGKGQYRLLVEDIVYEPVDEKGLTELVKRGVILGAEKIAEPGGEWRPINEHPVFRRLKKKMAIEAHALLAKYRRPTSQDESSIAVSAEAPDLSANRPSLKDNALDQIDFENPTPSVIEKLDDLSADMLEEESSIEQAQPPATPPPVDLPTPSPDLANEPEEEEADAPLEESTSEPNRHETQDDDLEEGMRAALANSFAEEEEDAPNEEDVEADHPLPVEEPEQLDEAARPAPLYEDDLTPPKGRSPWLIIGGVLLLGALITGGVLATQPDLREQIFGTLNPLSAVTDPTAPTEPATPSTTQGVEAALAAVQQARTTLFAALPRFNEASAILTTADALHASGAHQEAASLYQAAWRPEQHRDRAQLERYAQSLRETSNFTALRALATSGLARGEASLSDLFEGYQTEALSSDPGMRAFEPIDITTTSHGSSMQPIQSDRGVVFKLVDARGSTWAFHPAQRRYQDGLWQKDVVAWRTCQLIDCPFSIPETLPARLDASTLDALLSSGKAQRDAASFPELSWTADSEAQGGKVVQGTLVRWVEPGAFWPFTYTNTWRPWVTASEPSSLMDRPLAEALSNMQREDEDLYQSLLKQSDEMTTRDLAHQLSGAITFDFLVNNMNRFRDRVAYHGARDNQFTSGQFQSLDHSTAFNSRLSSRVKGRFQWVQRFDADMIAAIRALDPATSTPILFPEGSGISRAEQQAFWKRRDRLLAEVDELVARYGKEKVLFF